MVSVPTSQLEFSVSAAPFSAQGDGVTDDAGDIQATMTACSSAGGGIVRIPPGTFMVSTTLTLPSNVVLAGAGMGATVIQAMNGMNKDVIATAGGTTITSFCGVSSLTINGNKAGNASGASLNLQAVQSCVIDKVHVLNGAGIGILFQAADSSHQSLDNWVVNCRVEGTRNECIKLSNLAPDNFIKHNRIGPNDGGAGIAVIEVHNVLIGNRVNQSAAEGIYTNAQFGTFTGNQLENCAGPGLSLDAGSNHCAATGNICFNNGQGGAAPGIRVAGNYNAVTGNACMDNQGVKTQSYGIQIVSGATTNVAAANITRSADHLTGGLLDSGTTSVLSANAT